MLTMGRSVLWPIGHELFPGASTSLMVVAILLMWAVSLARELCTNHEWDGAAEEHVLSYFIF